ncbi:MAG: hypothetical protein IJK40_04980 [Clostridia bacterium]|nr:hypothetical protein [Clostridia bacterium]
MRIKNIEKLLKRTKTIVTMPDPEQRILWFSDGAVYVPLFDFSVLIQQQIFTLLNIPVDQVDKFLYSESTLPEDFNFTETDQNEELLERSEILLTFGGWTLEPLMTAGGIIYLSTDDLKSFEKEDENIHLYCRLTPEGAPYVAVKAGMFLKGLIMPKTEVVTPMLSNVLHYLATATDNTIKKAIEKE